MKRRINWLTGGWILVVWLLVWQSGGPGLQARPFAETISFRQPDGTVIQLRGEGDEFHAVFETLDGYSVIFDAGRGAYCYARLAPDGSLESTGALVHRAQGQALGLTRHLRMSAVLRKQQVAERWQRWEAGMQVQPRWNALKAASRQEAPGGAGGEDGPQSSPGRVTTGLKVGLTLLVDFDDDPASIPQADIISFCNADNYTGYGNNGSVKEYFRDVSNGLLTYTNVVTIYIRIPNSLHPKSYYNDPTRDEGGAGNELIRDAVAIMKALPNYATTILPAFNALTVDGANQVIALNVFYAGGNGGVWSKGLWPHSWSLYNVGAQELSPGGKKLYRYQITNIGTSLSIATFCHENGHMLCGFPDLYDYDGDSTGGSGRYCIMGSAGSSTNPSQVCAYLKASAGWATITDWSSSSRLTARLKASAGTNFNRFYRYLKPGTPTEYFIMENRQRAARDLALPGAGILIWHVDELGDHNNQSLAPNSTHSNYELTLVQADNRWDFQNDRNTGDIYDPYYSGNASPSYRNVFSDTTTPNANWWSGALSGLRLRDFSALGDTMSCTVGDGDVYMAREAEAATLVAPASVFSDPAASQGQYIASPTASAGTATFSFQAPVAGTYYIWCRVRATNAAQNSWNVSADAGAQDTFDAAEGAFSAAWQWVMLNGRGGTGVPLTVNPRSFALSAGAHTLVFRALDAGAQLDRILITTDPVYVPNDAMPTIVGQPAGATVVAGLSAVLTITASGGPELNYQWLSNGVSLAGATNANLTFANAQPAVSANYAAVVANIFGAVTSQVAVLTVVPVPARWAAFNDHYAGSGTHSNATAWNPYGTTGGAPGNNGPLRDIVTGATLPVTLNVTNANVTAGQTSGAPLPGTPAYNAFNGFVDFGSGSADHALLLDGNAVVAHRLSGLNPARRYTLIATAARGGSGGTAPNYYSNRWTRVELADADSFTAAHTPGVLTSTQVGTDLAANQAAFNSGVNTNGALVVWDNVNPGVNGELVLYSTRYTNTVPGGSSGGAPAYGLVALRVEESSLTDPPFVIADPPNQSVSAGAVASMLVSAAGHPAGYQWFKNNALVPGGTNAVLRFSQATTNDAANYFAVVTNAFGSATSRVATLTVTVPPGWVAYNDHAASGNTHVNATRWNIFGTAGGAPGSSGLLKDIVTGTNIATTLTIINNGGVAANSAGTPAVDSPAHAWFDRYVDFQGTPSPSAELSGAATTTYRFTGLDPSRRYDFRGTAVRGDPTYTNRWTQIDLVGAASFTNAHSAGTYTNGLATNQSAVNVGTAAGDVAGWDAIDPGPDGLIDVVSRQYTGAIPGGTANGTKSYAMTGFRLAEVILPVTIVTNPETQTVVSGSNAVFRVVARGSNPLTYQWRRDNVNIINATGSTLTLTNVQPGAAADYQVVIANSISAATSTVATLTVLEPPRILEQPVGRAVVQGSAAQLRVIAAGDPPLAYQWRLNNTNLVGRTNSVLAFASFQPADAGAYAAAVTGPGGVIVSSNAVLTLALRPGILQPELVAGKFSVSFASEIGVTYALKFKNSLADPSWQEAAVLGGTGLPLSLLDTNATVPTRFYRIELR